MQKTTKRVSRSHKAIKSNKKFQSKKKKLVGKGRFDLNPEERKLLSKSINKVFNTTQGNNISHLEIESSTLNDILKQVIEKARLYITKDSLENIPLPPSNNNKFKKYIGESTPIKNLGENGYTDKTIEYFKNILTNIKNHIPDKLSLKTFNIVSFQLIILFTEILLVIIMPSGGKVAPFEDRLFKKFLSYSGHTGKTLFDKDYTLPPYATINKYIDGSIDIPNELITNDTLSLKKNTCIVLFLGEIDVPDLVKTLANDIYVLGMTMEMEHADTFYVTPLGFLLHDITHKSNRESFFGLSTANEHTVKKRELAFINYLDSSNKLSDDEKYDIYIVLFLIIHESSIEPQLSLKKFKHTTWGRVVFIDSTMSWINGGLFTGLLPDKRIIHIKNKDNSITEEELDMVENKKPIPYDMPTNFSNNNDPWFLAYEKQEAVYKKYLKYIMNLFTEEWNEFITKYTESNK